MNLKNDSCSVRIGTDDSYVIGSPDNLHYDFEYNIENYDESDDFFKVLSIEIDLPDRKYTVALIGDGHCSEEDCAVLDERILTVLQGWLIIQLDVLTGELVRTAVIDSFGCNFALFRVNDNYLIYGEIDITMLDDSLQKLWSFSGNDIFVSTTDKRAFEIKNDRICLYDFNDDYYELDFAGRLF